MSFDILTLGRVIGLSNLLLSATNSWGLSATPKMPGTKRKFVSDGKDLLQSFAALKSKNPLDVHTLILGTLPSDKSYGQDLSQREIQLRGGEGHQNYGNSRNSFWNIVGSAFGFSRHETPFLEQVKILTDEGYAVWDVLLEAKRKGSLDSNLVKGSLTPTDLPRFVLDHPNLNRFVFAANSAEVFCKREVWGDWLATGTAYTSDPEAKEGKTAVATKFWIQGSELNTETFARTNSIFGKKKAVSIIDDLQLADSYAKLNTLDESWSQQRLIELIVMPSTSPANASNRPPEKEKKWHRACYRLQEPPKDYICPGCEFHRTETSNSVEDEQPHWFHDCTYRESWKANRRKNNTAKKPKKRTEPSKVDESEPEPIDPFAWYM